MKSSKPFAGKRILITGVGIKPVQYIYKDITTDRPTHMPIIDEGTEYKANIGTATAFECAKAGAIVHLVARTEDKLLIVKKWIEEQIPGAFVEYFAVDLGNKKDLIRLVNNLPEEKDLYWVQSLGLGAGTVKLKDDNPYLLVEDLSENLIDAELSVLKSTILLLQLLLPRFRNQEETRICIISSMSAVRSYWSGSIHTAAKGAISRFTNAAMIELAQDNIYITDVRPGGVDTGLYDLSVVRNRTIQIAEAYGVDWSIENGGPRFMPPSAVGKIIVSVLTSEAHIPSVNLVARGQWPHEGS